MNIPILNGVYTNGEEYRVSYPRNMVPVVQPNGISDGFLRPADGFVSQGQVTGGSRGGIEWDGVLYRVIGNTLYSINSSGVTTSIGSIPGSAHVAMDYSFDYLCIVGGGNAYLFDGTTLTQITDPDLGSVIDVIWVDGYFMFTDGTYLILTELTDPFSINPLRYGSSEVDPDPIVSLLKLRNEVYALNTRTIEVFNNVGGTPTTVFPFDRNEGALIQRGCMGMPCCAIFMEAIAFLGQGRNESPGVWIGLNGSTSKISTREIDLLLSNYTQSELEQVWMEVRVQDAQQLLYLHLPDRTIVYDGSGSASIKAPIWFILDSSLQGYSQYLARDFVWAYNQWTCADPVDGNYGYITTSSMDQWGETVGWDFSTIIVYNESKGAVFQRLELVSLPGRSQFGETPTVGTQYSYDGETWSQVKYISAGSSGQRAKRLCWFQQGFMRAQRVQRFIGTSETYLPVARLEATLEPLYG